ncbi:hypothetical protein MWH30_03840 [Fuchsiella alkaliacetigena]|nr:hypothetical protein [Fuchsiella alkaliacetigena]
MKDIFYDYSIPDFIDEKYVNLLISTTSKSSYFSLSTATYVVWENKVLKNPNLSFVEGTDIIY